MLDDALHALPFVQRGAVVLRFYGGLSIHEIAHALDCSPGTAGFELPLESATSLAQMFGQFEASAGLSVQSRQAASTTVYHASADVLAAFEAAQQQGPEQRRDEFQQTWIDCNASAAAQRIVLPSLD